MGHAYHDLTFTEAVKAHQEASGSRNAYASREDAPDFGNQLGPDEARFILGRDSFYLASVSETGWPYVQHRGGPKGFVQVLDPHTLVFAEFSGNKQYITAGNLDGDDRVSLFFMDYANRRRLKLLGHAQQRALDTVPDLAKPYQGTALERRLEAAMLIRIVGLDWNCPQYITPRFTLEEIDLLAMSPD